MKAQMIRLEDEDWEKLKEIGKRLDRPTSYMVRLAVKCYLANYRHGEKFRAPSEDTP